MGLGPQESPSMYTPHQQMCTCGECHSENEIKSNYPVGCKEYGFSIICEKITPQIWCFLMLDRMCKFTRSLVWGFLSMLQIIF